MFFELSKDFSVILKNSCLSIISKVCNITSQVPNNKTISATLDLVEFSCLNSVLKIRDPARGNEIIHIERTTFEKSKIVSSIHNKTKFISKHSSELNHHEDRKSNKTENSLKSENGQILILEYLAPRRSCRVNIKVTSFANGKIVCTN